MKLEGLDWVFTLKIIAVRLASIVCTSRLLMSHVRGKINLTCDMLQAVLSHFSALILPFTFF